MSPNRVSFMDQTNMRRENQENRQALPENYKPLRVRSKDRWPAAPENNPYVKLP